jgi:hypothetical protein
MEYSFGKTLLKIFKNLGLIGGVAAITAISDGAGEAFAELGTYAPLFVLGLQMGLNALLDYIKHK